MRKDLKIVLLEIREIEELLNALTGIKHDNRIVQKVKEKLREARNNVPFNDYNNQNRIWGGKQ